MANGGGGLIDDILVYRLPYGYAVVCNASNRGEVVAQFERHRAGVVDTMLDRTLDTAMIAVQGPRALATLQPLFNAPLDGLKYYHVTDGTAARLGRRGRQPDGLHGRGRLRADRPGGQGRARSGTALLDSGRTRGDRPVRPGRRDTLRFEAAMPLYGHELSETTNPYAAGVGWAVKLDKGEFVGREALCALQGRARPGAGRPPPRRQADRPPGEPGAARRPGRSASSPRAPSRRPWAEPRHGPGRPRRPPRSATSLVVDVRGHDEPARVVKLPFYRRSAAPSHRS